MSSSPILGPSRADCQSPYDEEHMDWASSVPKKYHRVPRLLRRSNVILVLIDIFIVTVLVHIFWPLITLLRRNEELFGARLTFTLNDTSIPPTLPEQQTIPRIFHQTSANETIPEAWTDLVQSCKTTYSDFTYMVC